MARLNIEQLLLPQPEFRIDLNPGRPPYRDGTLQKEFELPELCKAENNKRADGLVDSARNNSGLFGRESAKNLARTLRSGKRRCEKLARRKARRKARRTLSNSLYLRRMRIRFAGSAYKLLHDCGYHPGRTSTFTVNPRTFECEPLGLWKFNPRRLMQAFRAELVRNGAMEADGFLIAFVHGEFEPEAGIYVLHIHGIAAGGMIQVLDKLRKVDNYKPNTTGYLTGSTKVRSRVRISRKPLTDLLYTLAYTLKSYWPSKRIGPVGDDGKIKRQRDHHRIAEPYHSQVLLWLDQWSLSDITLLMKVRLGPEGFVLSDNRADGRKA